MEEQALALEITDRAIVYEFISKIWPAVLDMDFDEELYGKFFMIGFPDDGQFAIVSAPALKKHWDRMESGDQIRFVNIFRSTGPIPEGT